MRRILKKELNSPTQFKLKFVDFIKEIQTFIQEEYNILWNFDELGDIILSTCRTNDFETIQGLATSTMMLFLTLSLT